MFITALSLKKGVLLRKQSLIFASIVVQQFSFNERAASFKPCHFWSRHMLLLSCEVTKRVYFIGNERMLIAHDSNRLRFS